jgi:cell division protein FtsA
VKRNSIHTGIDVGNQEVRVVIGEKKANEEVDVLGVGVASLSRDSFQANAEVMVESIRRAVDEARNMASAAPRNVVAGISGTYLKGTNSKGTVRVREEQISENDVIRIMEPASAVPLGEGSRILTLLPQDYIVDYRPGVKDPRGIHGVRLDTRVHVVVANAHQTANLRSTIEKAGMPVGDIIPNVIAASEAVLHDGEKELGVLFLDLGSLATEIAVWLNGAVHYTGVVPFGGAVLTKDISKGLRLPQNHAEDVKQRYGIANSALVDEEELIEIPDVTGDSMVRHSRRILAEFIEPRLEELFHYLRDMIRESGMESEIRGGVVLTGGCSSLKGIDEIGQDILGLPVRIGQPEARNHISGMVEAIRKPELATATGLVLYGARGVRGGLYLPPEKRAGRFRRFMERMAASF